MSECRVCSEEERVKVINYGVFLAFNSSFDLSRVNCKELNAHSKESAATCNNEAVIEYCSIEVSIAS